ncbi:hypothetical protein EW026_g7623 [Hermanssonia centrifuga]|uniref:Uncharacterized protein n=1 Tax=Hermanssonia centrifuga TaxID=98765 RepID=A0A4S4K762_9APHY|nr:hypothetical protein EW026_g7623 [Hermanssonia centrifuga]
MTISSESPVPCHDNIKPEHGLTYIQEFLDSLPLDPFLQRAFSHTCPTTQVSLSREWTIGDTSLHNPCAIGLPPH